MKTVIDLTGQKFNRLTVIQRADDHVDKNGRHRIYWHCKCDCGNEVDVSSCNLKSGGTKSCGCFQRERASECSSKYNTMSSKYEVTENHIIALTNNNIEFYIDKNDEWILKEYCWSVKNNGYLCARDRKTKKCVLLHRLILKCTNNEIVDHINGNKLDNRKSNLRIVTSSQNSMNRKNNSNNTSGISGVTFHKQSNKWRVRIMVNYKRIDIGLFDNFEDAVAARKAAEEKYFGEYSFDNSRNKTTEQTEVVS